MTSPLQSELRARAAAHASQSEAGPDLDLEVAGLVVAVRRKRRGKSLVAAASGLCLAVAAAVAYSLAGGAAPVEPISSPEEVSPLGILGTLGPNDAVLTVSDGETAAPEIVIVHANASAVERVTAAEVSQALGPPVAQWPSVSLVALQPELSRAVFELHDSLAYVTPAVAVHDWVNGTTVVVDPCDSTLSSIDVFQWCPLGRGPEATVAPMPSDADPADYFVRCVGSGIRLGTVSSATCATADGINYLYLSDSTVITDSDRTVWELGPGRLEAPIVVDGMIFVNRTTTEGDPVLASSGGVEVEVGGAPVQGLGAVDGRLLVATNSDRWGAESSYGRVLGWWRPSTGEFEEVPEVVLGDDAVVTFVGRVR